MSNSIKKIVQIYYKIVQNVTPPNLLVYKWEGGCFICFRNIVLKLVFNFESISYDVRKRKN